MVSNDQFWGSSGCKEPGSMWNTQWLDTLRHGDYANMTHVPPNRIKRKAGRHKNGVEINRCKTKHAHVENGQTSVWSAPNPPGGFRITRHCDWYLGLVYGSHWITPCFHVIIHRKKKHPFWPLSIINQYHTKIDQHEPTWITLTVVWVQNFWFSTCITPGRWAVPPTAVWSQCPDGWWVLFDVSCKPTFACVYCIYIQNHIYICMYVCTYVRTYVCMYVSTCIPVWAEFCRALSGFNKFSQTQQGSIISEH